MPLIAANCTNCGANIKVDDTKEAGICTFCNTAFITEKVINNYVTNLNKTENVTQHITKNIYSQGGKPAYDYYEDAENLLRNGAYETAIMAYLKSAYQNPLDGVGWAKIIEALKLRIWNGDVDILVSELCRKRFSKYYKSLVQHVTPEKAAEIKAEFEQLINLDNSALWERVIAKSLEDFDSSGYESLEDFSESFIEGIECDIEEGEISKKTGNKIIKQFKKHLPSKLPEKLEPDDEDDSDF